jgi:hypothetical protein
MLSILLAAASVSVADFHQAASACGADLGKIGMIRHQPDVQLGRNGSRVTINAHAAPNVVRCMHDWGKMRGIVVVIE